MFYRVKVYKKIVAFWLSVILVFIAGSHYISKKKNRPVKESHGMSPQNLKIDDIYYHPEESDDNTEKVISMQRLEIASEYYKSNFKARSEFEDLLLEKGGEPVRSLIITGYRSGSQFLSFILSAVPGNFHFNEPLMQFKGTETIQIPPTQANDAVTTLKSIFKCEV